MHHFYDCFSWFAKLFMLVCSSYSVYSTLIVIFFLIQFVTFNGKGYMRYVLIKRFIVTNCDSLFNSQKMFFHDLRISFNYCINKIFYSHENYIPVLVLPLNEFPTQFKPFLKNFREIHTLIVNFDVLLNQRFFLLISNLAFIIAWELF